MRRKAGYIYVDVEWDLDGLTLRDAGVTRIVAIPTSEFEDHYQEAPGEWVADYLSAEYGWCVNAWFFA